MNVAHLDDDRPPTETVSTATTRTLGRGNEGRAEYQVAAWVRGIWFRAFCVSLLSAMLWVAPVSADDCGAGYWAYNMVTFTSSVRNGIVDCSPGVFETFEAYSQRINKLAEGPCQDVWPTVAVSSTWQGLNGRPERRVVCGTGNLGPARCKPKSCSIKPPKPPGCNGECGTPGCDPCPPECNGTCGTPGCDPCPRKPKGPRCPGRIYEGTISVIGNNKVFKHITIGDKPDPITCPVGDQCPTGPYALDIAATPKCSVQDGGTFANGGAMHHNANTCMCSPEGALCPSRRHEVGYYPPSDQKELPGFQLKVQGNGMHWAIMDPMLYKRGSCKSSPRFPGACDGEPVTYCHPELGCELELYVYCNEGSSDFGARRDCNVNIQVCGIPDRDGVAASRVPRAVFCGDDVLDEWEQCDDGNRQDGDCCSATCTLEAGCAIAEPLDLPAGHDVQNLTLGFDGNLWYTAPSGVVGRMRPDGQVLDPALRGGSPSDIVRGSDGAMWVTDSGHDAIQRIAPSAEHPAELVVKSYPLAADSDPSGVTRGGDGAIWFTETAASKIGRIEFDGERGEFRLREYDVPTGSAPTAILFVKDDMRVYFTLEATHQIGRIELDGTGMRLVDIPGDGGAVDRYSSLALGPDGQLWFTQYERGQLGRMNIGGETFEEFPLESPDSGPLVIERVGDSLWFTEHKDNRHGRVIFRPAPLIEEYDSVDTNGQPWGIAEGSDATPYMALHGSARLVRFHKHRTWEVGPEAHPHSLATGPDGTTWFTTQGSDCTPAEEEAGRCTEATDDDGVVGFITPRGELVTHDQPGESPSGIAVDRNGSAWFTLPSANAIVHMDRGGHHAIYPLSQLGGTLGAMPTGIVVGPDGAIWFTEYRKNKIGRLDPAEVDPDRQIQEFDIPTFNDEGARSIIVGPDGALWFTEAQANRIGRIDPFNPSGIQDWPLEGANTPMDLTIGPDGQIWFAEYSPGNAIGRFDIEEKRVTARYEVPGSGPFEITAAGNALWFTERLTHRLGRMTVDGDYTSYPLGPDAREPIGLVGTPEGYIYFAENAKGTIGRKYVGSPAPDLVLTDLRPSRRPHGVAIAPSGTVWFTEEAGGLGRIDAIGETTVEDLPGAVLMGITVAADETVWFADYVGNQIVHRTAEGDLEKFPVPTSEAGPRSVVVAPGGSIWFTEYRANKIGRLDPCTGQIDEYEVPSNNAGPSGYVEGPLDIVVGPDGALWFTEATATVLGRIDPTTLQIEEFDVGMGQSYLTVGPGGQLWFTSYSDNTIARFSIGPKQVTAVYEVPTPMSGPMQIVAAGGSLWFTEMLAGRVGQITTDGRIVEHYAGPSWDTAPFGLAVAPDGNLWFANFLGSSIGRVHIGEVGQASFSAVTSCSDAARCRHAGKASLQIKDRRGKRSFKWKWSKGEETAVADFGRPDADEQYELALFDATGASIHDAFVPSGSGWSRTSKGFKYKAKDRSTGEQLSVSLKAGGTGRAALQVKGKGAHMPTVPEGQSLTVRLSNAEECWETTFGNPKRHDESQYKAVAN